MPFCNDNPKSGDFVGLSFSFNELDFCAELASFQNESGALTHGSAKTLKVPAIGQERQPGSFIFMVATASGLRGLRQISATISRASFGR